MSITNIGLLTVLLTTLVSAGSVAAADGDSNIPVVTPETKLPLLQRAASEGRPKTQVARTMGYTAGTGDGGVTVHRGTARYVKPNGMVMVLVRKGDCLSKIAEELGVPLEILEQANGITQATEDRIRAGSMLMVPVGRMTVETKGATASVSTPQTVAKNGGLRGD